eukprot:3003753-Amphidinium_carterae.1
MSDRTGTVPFGSGGVGGPISCYCVSDAASLPWPSYDGGFCMMSTFPSLSEAIGKAQYRAGPKRVRA